jgi:ATP-dependent helicase/nuclease subunit B
MALPPAQVFSIPAGVPFADSLARGLLERAAGDPLALAAMTVLLPNRRAVRALGEAFLRQGGGRALLLPRLLPLGDVDAEELALGSEAALLDPAAALALRPALAPLRRQALLAQLVATWARAQHLRLSGGAVAELAQELAALVDEAETNEVALDGLAKLVPDRYAEHWQRALAFLALAAEVWPALEAQQGALSPATRRRRLLELQAEAWQRKPPPGPVIAAGSTGSIPAVARLMAVVARLPQGAVVLPGLDEAARGPLWQAILEDPAHPQHGLALLLKVLETAPEQVRRWPAAPPPTPRVQLIQTALRPAAMTDSWRDLLRGEAAPRLAEWRQALAGLAWIDCPGPREEATVIALKLREALETPGRTAALVTPDRALARRVRVELGRWGLAVDDSAGTPLDQTPPLVFLRLLALAAAERLAPLALLSLLKHPLASGGEAPASFRAKARRLERLVLRGPRPGPDLAGLLAALAAERDAAEAEARGALVELHAWVTHLGTLLAPYLEALQPAAASPGDLLRAQLLAAEALAASDRESGALRLWQGEAGEAAAELFAAFAEAGDFPPIEPGDWPALLQVLLRGQAVRPAWGSHPRLAIWGPLEARLQQADLMILGGLNEGTWPAESDPGAWLSRPMRRDLGLPPPERRVGMAAHDLAQALAAPEVILTRAVKVEGAPTLPARWLLRLDALLRTLGLGDALSRWRAEDLGWCAALDQPEDQPDGPTLPAPRPAPRPPVALRPRRLSVTRVEVWKRNPYGIFAQYVLGLEALPALDEDPAAAERGQLVHKMLERFATAFPARLPPQAEGELRRILDQELAAAAARPGLALLWRPRLERIAAWYLAEERRRRAGIVRLLAETRGRLVIEGPAGRFTLTAIADRLELEPDGRVAVVDYKTGTPPTNPQVESGHAPQLPLEAAILQCGGFEGLPPSQPSRLEYWHLTGGAKAGAVKPVKRPAGDLAADAYDWLERLVERFDDPETAYLAWPDLDFPPRFDAYALLARVPEWAPGEEE